MDDAARNIAWWPNEQPVGFPRPRLVRWFSQVALLGLVGSYLISSHMPSLSTESLGLPSRSDKLIHTGIFFLITVLMLASLRTPFSRRRDSVRGWLTWAGVFLAVIALACLDEWTQPFFGRHSDLMDLSCDAIGIELAFALLTVKMLLSRQEIERPTGATLTRVR